METERFEDKIKRQLQDREITPSARSWEQLSAKLIAPQKKQKPFAFWMGVAASIIAGILLLSLVFHNSTLPDTPEIVDMPLEEGEVKNTPLESSREIITSPQEEAIQVSKSKDKEEPINPKTNETILPVEKIKQVKREAVAVLDNKSLLKEQSLITPSVLTGDQDLDMELNNTLSSVISHSKYDQTITDAEVNKLLEDAATKISQERYKSNFSVGRVNHQDLLQQVEFEMDNTFREKIFEILKEGYSKAKTAIAHRNY
jgi:hypothetical protein